MEGSVLNAAVDYCYVQVERAFLALTKVPTFSSDSIQILIEDLLVLKLLLRTLSIGFPPLTP